MPRIGQKESRMPIVMLVDDAPIHRKAMRRLLECEGFGVVEAAIRCGTRSPC